jgi:uncharacterized protein
LQFINTQREEFPLKTSIIRQTADRRVILFLILLSILTIATSILISRMAETPVASLLMMWTPAFAAILAGVITRRPFREMGWRLRPVKWLAVGWLIPVAYGFVAYGLLWITGLGGVPKPLFLERARITLNMPDVSSGLLIAAAFGYISIINLLPSMLMSLGEEMGWRGFLVPELAKGHGPQKAAIYSGLIWFLWHLPGIWLGGYGAGETPLPYRVGCFALLVISGGVIFAWLRMRSASLWPVVILHAAHNNLIQAFFDRITFDTGYTSYFAGEFGIALVLVNLAFAVWCWHQLARPERKHEEIPERQALANG